MILQYPFPASWANQNATLRAGMAPDATILAAFTVSASRMNELTVANPTTQTSLWYRREGDGALLPAGVFVPDTGFNEGDRTKLTETRDLVVERLSHSDELPPGPVEFYPSGEGDFVYVDVFTVEFIGTIEANVPVTISLVDKTVAYAEAGFPTEYSATINSDETGKARFYLAKASAIRPIMTGATHKGKIKNQTFYLRPADTSGKASKMLVAGK